MSVSTVYAKALYEGAKATPGSDFAQIETQLEQFLAMMTTSKELCMALVGPLITAKEKTILIEAVATRAGFTPLVSRFIMMLAKKGRLKVLREITEAFGNVRLQAEGGISGNLVAADPVSEADIEGLAKAFSQKLGKKVAFRVSTDASLLAGMKVTVNGITYDGTLRSQLQRLRDRFVLGMSG